MQRLPLNRPSPSTTWRVSLAWLMVALLGHGLAWMLLERLWSRHHRMLPSQPETVVWLQQESPKRPTTKSTPRQSSPKNMPEPETMPQGQIVEIAPPQEVKKPKDSAFLAQWDQDVAKQTRSAQTSLTNPGTTPVPLPGIPPKDPVPTFTSPSQKPSPSPPPPQIPSQEGVNHEQAHPKPLSAKSKDSSQDPATLIPPTPNLSQLMPSLGALIATPGGGMPFADHLEDVDVGPGTFLRTRQFRYASFFNRLKRQIGQYWPGPDTHWKLRSLAAALQHGRKRTVLMVGLDRQGHVVDLTIQESSGLAALDEDALAAFRKAEPFPNPPQALFNAQGVLYFDFSFVVGH